MRKLYVHLRSYWKILTSSALLLFSIVVTAFFFLNGYQEHETLENQIKRVIFSQDQALVASEKNENILTVLIPYDRTRFFIEKGEPLGFEYELVRQFEDFAKKKFPDREQELTAIFLPTPFSELIPLLADGVGDLAAGGLTVTDQRLKLVDFTDSYIQDVEEIVVSHKTLPPLGSTDELAGLTVTVVDGSSYHSHLEALSERLIKNGLAPVNIQVAGPALASEDILELVHTGVITHTVVDSHIAQLWATVLDGIRLEEHMPVVTGTRIAWAIPKSTPNERRELLNAFIKETKTGTLIGNILFKRYYKDNKWIRDPYTKEAIKELSRYKPLFEKNALDHGLDWRLVAAVAFQESGFDPFALSDRGARGLMQVLPETAQEMGINDLNSPEAQIEAGTRYLAKIRNALMKDGSIDEYNATQLALAAYNAGPTRLKQLREMTKDELNLDPDRWFLNVERAAAITVGRETVDYVAKVNKYRLAYELGEKLLDARAQELTETIEN